MDSNQNKKNKLEIIKNLPDATEFENNKVTHKVDWVKINVTILLIVLGVVLGIVIILLLALYLK